MKFKNMLTIQNKRLGTLDDFLPQVILFSLLVGCSVFFNIVRGEGGGNPFLTAFKMIFGVMVIETCNTVGGTSDGFGKSSLKHSKSFWIFLSNQKLARALANTPKVIAPANPSCCLATS